MWELRFKKRAHSKCVKNWKTSDLDVPFWKYTKIQKGALWGFFNSRYFLDVLGAKRAFLAISDVVGNIFFTRKEFFKRGRFRACFFHGTSSMFPGLKIGTLKNFKKGDAKKRSRVFDRFRIWISIESPLQAPFGRGQKMTKLSIFTHT